MPIEVDPVPVRLGPMCRGRWVVLDPDKPLVGNRKLLADQGGQFHGEVGNAGTRVVRQLGTDDKSATLGKGIDVQTAD